MKSATAAEGGRRTILVAVTKANGGKAEGRLAEAMGVPAQEE